MKRFYIEWIEKKNGGQTRYRTWADVENREAAKEKVREAQQYRLDHSMPHMFQVYIGQHCTNSDVIYKTLTSNKI